MKKFICDRIYRNNLFFCDTWKIVIECTSVYDIFCCFSDVCCLIDQRRRISRTSSDSSLTGRKNCGHNTRTSGCCDQMNVFVLHHNIACFHCRMLHCHCNVIRSANFYRCFIQQIHCINRCFDRCRMWIEYHCISSCQHTNRITEYCLTRVRTWSDCSDHTERSHLDQSKSSVP